MDLGWVKAERDYLKARTDVEGCRLLSRREMSLLFPDGPIQCEWFGPFLKSLMAVRNGL